IWKQSQNISQKLTSKKRHTPNTGRRRHGKNNNKQKPPNTLLSSQTTGRLASGNPATVLGFRS
ncbi:hypothetical protein, partial [Mycolicibacter nonchromogenicus]|uniref:hypothetical protein n=1 Tax=Mycolicibacter nonchromogenicus TaxID=1782 RepID=UPI001A9756FA